MKSDPICFTKQKFIFENERERERDLEKKGIDEIPYTNLYCVYLLCLMLLSLSAPLFFSSFYVFAVCVLVLFFCVSACFSFFFFFFKYAGDSLIYREIGKLFPLFFIYQLISSWATSMDH